MHSKKSKESNIDYHLKVTWQNIATTYNAIASSYGITQAIGFILLNVDEEKGTSVSDIANLLGQKTTSLSRMLLKLESLGAIKRKVDAKDKRKVIIMLTNKGKEKRKLAKNIVKDFNNYLASSLNAKEYKEFIKTIQKINSSVERYKVSLNK